jgi:hypothetical protein
MRKPFVMRRMRRKEMLVVGNQKRRPVEESWTAADRRQSRKADLSASSP